MRIVCRREWLTIVWLGLIDNCRIPPRWEKYGEMASPKRSAGDKMGVPNWWQNIVTSEMTSLERWNVERSICSCQNNIHRNVP